MAETPIEFDAVLDLCRRERRRIVLAALADRRQPARVDELVAAVVGRDHGAPPSAVDDETVERVELSLHHVHLPRLEDAGLVEYDTEQHRVERTAHFERAHDRIAAVLDVSPALATLPEL